MVIWSVLIITWAPFGLNSANSRPSVKGCNSSHREAVKSIDQKLIVMGEMFLQPAQHVVPTVIYLDDDAANRQAFLSSFRKELRILLAADAAQVWDHLSREEVHVLIADQRLPGMQGSEVLRQVKEKYPLVQRMIMTGYSDIQAVIDAINLGGVSQYLQKPWDHHQVMFSIRKGFLDHMKERERSDHTQQLIDANQQLEFALRQRLLS